MSAVTATAGRRRPLPFWIMIGLILLLGLGAAGGGAAGVVATATRHPSQAQISAAGQREFAVQWQRLSAGRIFPSSVSYLDSFGGRTTATLVGIAPQAPCGSTVDAAAAPVLAASGCVTVLRATYTDASQTAVATIGIAVLRSPGDALRAQSTFVAGGRGGLLALGFPGTVASLFTGSARETYAAKTTAGRYLFLYAAGYTDGRRTTLQVNSDGGYTGETVTTDLGNGVVSQLSAEFQAPAQTLRGQKRAVLARAPAAPRRTPRYSSLRSRSRSFMLASIFTRPATQARAMFIGDSASDTTSSLFAVSRMSAGGSPGPISRTGASPEPSLVPNVTPRSGIVTLIVWLPKYASRSAGFSSDSLLASFCSASRHSSADFMCASFLNGRYRSRGG